MRLNLTVNNVNITLEGTNNNDIMGILGMLMNSNTPAPMPENNIRTEFRKAVEPVLPPQAPTHSYMTTGGFIPCSDKQKKLLRSIPEFKGADLNTVSKSEASMAIERWNKSRAYHYKDHY